MKLSSPFNRHAVQKTAALMFTFMLALPALLQAAQPNPPSLSGTANNISINDTATSAVFGGTTVIEGDTNVLTVHIGFSPANVGGFNLPVPGVVQIGGGYLISANSGAAATATLHQLVFTPVSNAIPVLVTSNVTFNIYVTDVSATNNTSSTNTTILHVLSLNDAPTLAASGVVNIDDKSSGITPFSNLTLTDPDNSNSQPQTLTVMMNQTNSGYLVTNSTSVGFTSNNFIYSFTGTPAEAQAAVRGLVFLPIENVLPVGQTATNTFKIVDTDTFASVTNNAVKVLVLSSNDVPFLTGVPAAHVAVQTGQSGTLFPQVSLLDPDQNLNLSNKNGEDLTWSVVLGGASPIGNLVLNGVSIGLSYSSAGDPSSASGVIRSLSYTAPTLAISGTNAMTLTITAADGHGGTASSNVLLDVYSVVSPPGLTGTQSGQIVNDNSTIALFSKIGIQSFNGNSVTVQLALYGVTSDEQGQLFNLGSFTRTTFPGAPSVYSYSGTSEGATAAIRSLLFQPTPNRINGSANETATFSIRLIDGTITNNLDTTTTVIVVPVNDAPAIAGISPLILIADNQTAPPFPGVLITDVDESNQQPVTAVVTLDDPAKGGFSAANLATSGFTFNTNNNSYSFSGVPTNLTAAIRQLVFTPTPGRVAYGLSEITTFTISLNDNHGGLVANSATAVRVTPVNGLPVVTLPTPQPVSLPVGPNIFVFQGVSISDATTLKVYITIYTNAGVVGKFTTNSVAAFTALTNGSYFISGPASNVTAAVQQLDFSPATNFPPGSVTNYFIISATNSTLTPAGITVTHAVVLRTVPTSFIVTRLTDYNPTNNSVSDSEKAGTLRKAIAAAKNNDHITFDIRSTVVGQPDYPAVIRLVAPVVLDKNLTFDGPGAERLSISGDTNANGTADIQLFTVNALVTMNRLTFTKGYASSAGGAFEVNEFGALNLSYCAVTDCAADVWGGGVDVNQGSLVLDHCLIAGNRTSSTFGQGGGGVSFYTFWPCTIFDTTFATNRQNAVGGLGGGAIYAETADAGTEFDLAILNCTFRDNRDGASHGSSIRPNVFNTVVQLQNTIVADGQGKNIEMDLSGAVISLGGNISDDATTSIFSSGGSATNTFIFHTPADQVNVPATNLLAALANNGGPTLTHALTANSPAIGNVISNSPGAAAYAALGTDQRGYFRSFANNLPDIGAFERGAAQRVIIQELRFNPGADDNTNQFIEFYVPRDSTNVNFGGFQVLVDGALRHTFASQTLQPGEALVLFSKDATNAAVPSGVYSQISDKKLSMDKASGVITLLNVSGQVVFTADYVGSFTATDTNDYGHLAADYQSLVLSPSFQGVFLPYQRVVVKEGGGDTNGLANPGYDPTGKPIAIGNAPPIAYADLTATDAHTLLSAINVLGNDFDPDINDLIRVVAVGTNGNVAGSTNYSVLGARVVINNSPTNGVSVSYDPTASAFLTSLPQGSNVVDSFQYAILDSLNGVDHLRSATTNALEIAQNLAKATATVTVNIAGVNAAPTPQPDTVVNSPRLTTPEDVLLDFTTVTNVLANDTDPNSDDNSNTLNIVSINDANSYVSNRLAIVTALGASATLDVRFDRNETHITYDPRGSVILNTLGLGQSTNDTFYYSVKDRYGVIGTSPVSILVTGVNDAPTANPDSFVTDEDTAVAVSTASLFANDTDPDIGSLLSVTYVTPVSALGADVSLSGTNLIYNPAVSATLNALANKEFTNDTFTYTATDEHGLSSNTIVTVTIAGVNDKPISQPDAYLTDEETVFAISGPGVLANDVEPDINGISPDDAFRVQPATNTTPGGVTVVVNADGSFGYDPRGLFDWLKQGQTTNDAFSYVVMDHSLSIAGDDDFAVTTSSSNNVLPVLANDAVLSLAGGAFTITGVTMPTNGGAVALNAASNAIIYTPLAGYVGTETFSYAVSDGLGGGDTANVTVTLKASSLYASADAFTVARGTTNSLDVLANDRVLPATGAAISVTSLGTPNLGGTVSLNGVGPNNLVSYTPNPTNPCPFVETFSYAVTSGSLVSTGVVSITVLDLGNSLAANNDGFTVIANGGTTSLDVLANDMILPGPNTNLIITAFTSNSVLGTVSLNAAHTRLLYKPSGTVTNHQEPLITYTVSDNAGGTATASVSVHVTPGGFLAGNDTFVVVKNSTNTLPVMVNDVILPNLGQTLFISGTGIGTNAPSHGGTIAINGPGTGLIYAPPANFSGAEDFTYEITDGSPSRALGHVHVVVLDNSPATSNPDTYRVDRDSANNALLVLKNDYALPPTPGAFTLTGLQTNGVHATVSIAGAGANNSLLYSPAAGFIGTDMFRYELIDTLGNKGTNSVVITVGSLAPQADSFSVLSDSVTNQLAVLANDLAYPDTNSVRAIYQIGTPDNGGSAGANSDATQVIYTPAPGFTGTEHFTYTLKDDSTNLFTATVAVHVYARGSDRDTNTVTLTVSGVNDLPGFTGNTNRAITDKQTVQPFATLTLADLDEYGSQLQTVHIYLDHLDNGTLQNLGGFTQTAPGLFTLYGTPANITTALRGILFAPVPNHIPVPTTVTTHLTLSADDSYVIAPVTNLTTVDVTAVNDAPVISGTVAGQTVYSHSAIKPFVGALITEVDNDRTQALRVTVTLDSVIKGGLSSLGGFTSLGAGVYSLGASNGNVTAAIATAALRGLVFTPTVGSRVSPGTPETTRFTIRVDDFFAPTVVDANTTVVATHPLTAKVTASDKTANSQFGWSVATTRDLAVVGAPHDATGTKSGSAYLYARSLDGLNTWTQVKKLLPPDGQNADEFGTAVAISGDTIVVGARLRDDKGTDSGGAYVYMRDQGGADQWGFVKKLLATDGAASDQFGTAVSISGDIVSVGSPLANAAGLGNAGAVYIFTRNLGGTNQWGQFKKVAASAPVNGDHFGSAVSINVDTLVAGAPQVAGGGAAYVYTRNQGGADQWGFVKKIVAGDGLINGQFGAALSIQGDIVAVSAPLVNASGLGDSGAAYVFTRNQGGSNQWGQVKKLVASDPASGDHFGSAVAVNADTLVVGAQLADGNGADSGAAYVFAQNQGGSNLWGQVDKFLPSAVGASDNFGSAVAISSGTIVAGAYNGLDSGVRYGTAFMFRIKYNNAPQVLSPLANQTVTVNSPLAFTMPAGTFADPDVNETLQLSLGAVPVAPAWLSFDPVTGAFSGTPTAVNTYPVAVTATDADGASAVNQFDINVVAAPNTYSSLSMGFQSFGAGQVIVVSLNGVSGAGYRLQRTSSLSGNVIWTDVATGTADVYGAISFYDTMTSGSMFYRAVAP